MNEKKEYLVDLVDAKFDQAGNQIVLTYEHGTSCDMVYLEHKTFLELIKFVRKYTDWLKADEGHLQN